jgi:hypothetical protein
MITNPEWFKTEETPCVHQISPHCIEKLVECAEIFNKGEIDADTSFEIERQILYDEIYDPEFLSFVIANFGELSSYIASGKTNIRIHRDIEGEMWFEVYKKRDFIF